MKTLTTLIASCFVSLSAMAFELNDNNNYLLKDKSSGEKCFDDNTHIINVGVGLGNVAYYKYHGGTYHSSPAFSVSYEQPWKQRIGPGYLGVGGYVGFQTTRYKATYTSLYDFNGYYYEHHWTSIMATGRAAYHWDVLNSEKAEVYAGVIIGARISLYSYETNDPRPENEAAYKAANSFAYPAYSVFAGARWYFVKNIGVYGEVGYGISYLTGGLSFKF